MITFTTKQKEIHSYIIRCTRTTDNKIGLFYGKLGASIIFYELGRSEGNSAYTRYADNLLDQVWFTNIKYVPLSFDFGIYGIGWGLEYLIQNKFVDGVGIDVCEDINKKIIEIDPRRHTDLSLETGLSGLIFYLLIHIRGCKQQKTPIFFERTFLKEVNDSAQKSYVNNEYKIIVDVYNTFITTNRLNYNPSIFFFKNAGDIEKKSKSIGLSQNDLVDKLLNVTT